MAVLYNKRHTDYSIKQNRNNALDSVRMQLESAGVFAATTDIQNKLQVWEFAIQARGIRWNIQKNVWQGTDEVIKTRWL